MRTSLKEGSGDSAPTATMMDHATACFETFGSTDLARADDPLPRARIHLVFLEGVIGAGKSTLVDSLADQFNEHFNTEPTRLTRILFVDEPVKEWEEPIVDAEGLERGSLLQHLYDQRVNPFAFQMLVLTQRFAMLTTAINRARIWAKEPHVQDVYVVAERSLIGDKLFAEINLKTYIDHAMYEMAHRTVRDSLATSEDIDVLVIYLRLDVATARERVRGRGRKAERGLLESDSKYLDELTAAHERMFVRRDDTGGSTSNAKVNMETASFQPTWQWMRALPHPLKLATVSAADAPSRVVEHVVRVVKKSIYE